MAATRHVGEIEEGSITMQAMVVDDDPRNRDRVTAILVRAGHTVRGYDTADAAAAALAALGHVVELMVTDVQMPGDLDGVDLAAIAAVDRPDLPVVIMSSDPWELRRARARGLAAPTLEKPIAPHALLSAVLEAVRQAGSPRTEAAP
jgi:DNA-binding NtrC family response regulator